jgi:hypothetical protein
VEIARSLLPQREKINELFALEVQGDSMVDAMINDGDIIIVKPAQEAANGEMVASGWTIKTRRPSNTSTRKTIGFACSRPTRPWPDLCG